MCESRGSGEGTPGERVQGYSVEGVECLRSTGKKWPVSISSATTGAKERHSHTQTCLTNRLKSLVISVRADRLMFYYT